MSEYERTRAIIEGSVKSVKCVMAGLEKEQMDSLVKSLLSFDETATKKLQCLWEKESVSSLDDMLDAASRLNEFDFYPEITTEHELGVYLVENGDIYFEPKVRPYLNYNAIGIEYHAEHSAYFGVHGYICHSGCQVQELDKDRPEIFKVHLYTPHVGSTMTGPYKLKLPASDEVLEQALSRIGVTDFNTATIIEIECSLDGLGKASSYIQPSVSLLNEIAIDVEGIMKNDGAMETFYGAVYCEGANTWQQVANIIMDLDDYEMHKGFTVAEEYGEYVLNHPKEFDFNMIEDVKDFVDLDAYGEYRMKEDGVLWSQWGLMRRLSSPFTQSHDEMKMGGIS